MAFIEAPDDIQLDSSSDDSSQPLNVRNNNPGNMRDASGKIASYDNPDAGMNALKHDLTLKLSGNSPVMQAKFGKNYTPSISTVISTWAPPTENNTDAYIANVANKTGIDPHAPLSAADVDRILPAIIHQEGGKKATNYFGTGTRTADAGNIMTDANVDPSGTLPVTQALGNMVNGGDGTPPGPSGTVVNDTQVADNSTPVKLGPPVDHAVPGDVVINKTPTFVEAPDDIKMDNTAPNPADKPFIDKVADTAPGAALIGLGEGLTRGAVGAIQAGAQAVGANNVAKAAGQVIDQGEANRARLGTAGAIGGFVGDAAPYATIAGPETLAGRVLAGGATGLAQDVLRPQDSQDTSARLDPTKAAVATGVGAALPLALAGGGAAIAGVKSAALPSIDADTAALAQRATKDFNIPLRVDQVAPSAARDNIQKVSQALPFSGQPAAQQIQRTAFNKAVANTLGPDVQDLSPQSINTFKARVGQQFDDVLDGNPVTVDPSHLKTLDQIASDAKEYGGNEVGATVQKQVDKLKANIGDDGIIQGTSLANFRSALKANAVKAGNATPYLNDVLDTTNNIADSGLTGDQSKALAQARNQWRNYSTIKPLLEKSTDGEIDPTQLLNKVATSKYITASQAPVGKDDLVDLARIGKQFMPTKGGSDTAFKTLVMGSALDLPITAAIDPAAAAGQLATTGGLLGLNRAYQSLYNQSPRVVSSIIKNSLGNAAQPVLDTIAKGGAPEDVVNAIQKSGASPEDIQNTMNLITRSAKGTNMPVPRGGNAPDPMVKPIKIRLTGPKGS